MRSLSSRATLTSKDEAWAEAGGRSVSLLSRAAESAARGMIRGMHGGGGEADGRERERDASSPREYAPTGNALPVA